MSTPWVSSCASTTTSNHIRRSVSKFSFETSTPHSSDFITAENIKHCAPTRYSNDMMQNFQLDSTARVANNISKGQLDTRQTGTATANEHQNSPSQLNSDCHRRQYSFEYSQLELGESITNLNIASSPNPNAAATTPSKLQNRNGNVDFDQVNLSALSSPQRHHQQQQQQHQHQQQHLQNLHSFQQPPNNVLSHGYSSSISSVSSTGSIPSSPGMINYSPKHSRIANSFNIHKNMKNLSLNLNDSNGSSNPLNHTTLAAKRLKLSDSTTNTTTTTSSSDKLNLLNFAQPLFNNSTIYSERALQTPSVTHTPTLPPHNLKLQHHLQSHGDSDIDTRSTTGAPNKPYKFPLEITGPQPDSDAILFGGTANDLFNERTQPPMPPPFAPNSKASPLSTPPRLQSPMGLDKQSGQQQQHHSPTKLLRNIKKMSIESPLETNFSKPEVNSFVHSSTPQSITYNSKKFSVPEELQETSAINAYPNGPRNVLNSKIFLYSDPLNKIDINQYNLVINVAKECTNLSSNFQNQEPNVREYLHLPWSHTSAISKDLMELTHKIDWYYQQGMKVLVHCQCGVSRSACVVVAFYMMKFGIGVNAAYEMLKNGTLTSIESEQTSNITVDKCERICPNMSLIFELMEFGDKLNKSEFSTLQLLAGSPTQMSL